jgi:phage tail-like protein
VVDLLLCDVDRWTDIIDVDVAEERYLDQMLIGLGNPFSFAAELDADDKRRLIRVLVGIYQLKGTARGIIDAIRFFLGIEVEIVTYLGDPDIWVMGEDELGVGTFLGPGDQRARFSFEIISPVGLTDEQRERIRAIVDLMKPGHTHLIRIVEPTPPEVADPWELGLSELSIDTFLH